MSEGGFVNRKEVRNMKEILSEKINKFMNEAFVIPPTLEELNANFPHKEGCGMSMPLRQFEKEEFVDADGMSSGWVRGPFVRVTRKYLECDNCQVQAKFSE